MFETKKDNNETETRTLVEVLYGSIAIKEQALSSKIFLWAGTTWRSLWWDPWLDSHRELAKKMDMIKKTTYFVLSGFELYIQLQ